MSLKMRGSPPALQERKPGQGFRARGFRVQDSKVRLPQAGYDLNPLKDPKDGTPQYEPITTLGKLGDS